MAHHERERALCGPLRTLRVRPVKRRRRRSGLGRSRWNASESRSLTTKSPAQTTSSAAPTSKRAWTPNGSNQPRGDLAAERRAERATERNHREEPLSLLGRVEIVRERPELRDDHHVEDADPHEEHEPHVSPQHGNVARHVKQHEVRREEQGHADDQAQAR